MHNVVARALSPQCPCCCPTAHQLLCCPLLLQLALCESYFIRADNCWLDDIPPEVFGKRQLQELGLSHNRISVLPPAVGNLRALKSLRISHNRLEALPSSLCMLDNLKSLDVSHNSLSSLPAEMAYMTHLTSLKLVGNPLDAMTGSAEDTLADIYFGKGVPPGQQADRKAGLRRLLAHLRDHCLTHEQKQSLAESQEAHQRGETAGKLERYMTVADTDVLTKLVDDARRLCLADNLVQAAQVALDRASALRAAAASEDREGLVAALQGWEAYVSPNRGEGADYWRARTVYRAIRKQELAKGWKDPSAATRGGASPSRSPSPPRPSRPASAPVHRNRPTSAQAHGSRTVYAGAGKAPQPGGNEYDNGAFEGEGGGAPGGRPASAAPMVSRGFDYDAWVRAKNAQKREEARKLAELRHNLATRDRLLRQQKVGAARRNADLESQWPARQFEPVQYGTYTASPERLYAARMSYSLASSRAGSRAPSRPVSASMYPYSTDHPGRPRQRPSSARPASAKSPANRYWAQRQQLLEEEQRRQAAYQHEQWRQQQQEQHEADAGGEPPQPARPTSASSRSGMRTTLEPILEPASQDDDVDGYIKDAADDEGDLDYGS